MAGVVKKPAPRTLTGLLGLRLTDHGNAMALKMMFGDLIRYCPEEKGWRVFEEGIWRSKADSRVYEMVIETVQERSRRLRDQGRDDKDIKRHLEKSENWGSVRNTVSMAASLPGMIRSASIYDNDPDLMGVGNGMVDLKTGRFRESIPEDWMTMRAGCQWDGEAKAPRWEGFLREVFDEDEKLIEYVQKAIGYCLTGHTSEQIFFLCWGSGANGKSTFLEVVKTLLGDYGSTAPLDIFDARRKSEQTNDLARMMGRRFVTIIESEQDRQLAESKIKSATGEEAITCRFLYGEFFEYVPQFKIWLAANHLPNVRGTDHGIWRRMRIVPFLRKFDGNGQVKGLKAELIHELPGILNWALDGLARWRKEGIGEVPEKVATTTAEYREDCDVMGQWLGACVEMTGDQKDYVMGDDLYQSYKHWMEKMGLRTKGVTQWGIDMKQRPIEKKRSNRGNRYFGIQLREEQEWKLEEI